MNDHAPTYARRDFAAGVVVDGLLLYLPEQQSYAFLNEEAAEIWDALQSPLTAPELSARMQVAGMSSDESTQIVESFLNQAVELGLVSLSEA